MNKLVITSTALLSLAALQPVLAEPARPQSVMNQTSVYETTLKFFLHPARLEWTDVAPTRMGEHLSSDHEPESFASLLQLHNQALPYLLHFRLFSRKCPAWLLDFGALVAKT